MQMSGLSRRLRKPSPACAVWCTALATNYYGFGPERRYRLYRRRELEQTCRQISKLHRETQMAVDGNWNITMSTPMGDRPATLSLKSAGGELTGTQAAEGNSAEIFEGKADGDDVVWKVSITSPMPLTLEFTGKVSGNDISGEMLIGPMGRFPFTGTRA